MFALKLKNFQIFTKLQSLLQKATIFSASHLRQTNDGLYDEILEADREYEEYSQSCLKLDKSHNCYIIQPYIKWGPKKLKDISSEEQLDEAKALINTLPAWSVEETVTVPLESLDKKTVFGSGSLEKLKQNIRKMGNVNAVFVNVGVLKRIQARNLEAEFNAVILDRYRIVMQILKIHATSKHAKLQVALAELYYLQRTAVNESNFAKQDREKIKLIFQNREQKLISAIQRLRAQRSLLRNRRQKNDYPVIAVVGYTNAGKTSLIKALTGEEQLKPRNKLFATLDVTMHAGILPSGLKVLYVDTVGFISDIPTNLIECFVATLEDAILADIILHVEDISSSCYEFKNKHVLKTLQDLAAKSDTDNLSEKIVSVGNKSDLVPKDKDFRILRVSSKTDVGLDALRLILEKSVMKATNRQQIKIRVPSGEDAIRWLYKNSTVVSESVDEKSNQFIIANVIITNGKLQQFKHNFKK